MPDQFRAQLHSLDRFQEDEPPHQFREASEDLQPGEPREDIYGNPVLSPEERAEAEERQEEECARRRDRP